VRFPFPFYARLEVAIAIAAILTPKLLELARSIYLSTGGLHTTATLVQIGITALILGVPCFLMGVTLPAAMKFAQRDDDPNRSTTALFYAMNMAANGARLMEAFTDSGGELPVPKAKPLAKPVATAQTR
jgi:hypothetical protein